jgi:peptidoglycan hydrolase-like protein with peptidoglycan-binding domain
MRTTAIALLASVALALPAVAAQSSGSQNQYYGSSQGQQSSGSSWKQQGANQRNMQTGISAHQLSQNQIRQIQTALNNAGFNVGRADGNWGQRSRTALRNFEQSKGIQPTGQINQQALRQLGLNSNQFMGSRYGSARGGSSNR